MFNGWSSQGIAIEKRSKTLGMKNDFKNEILVLAHIEIFHLPESEYLDKMIVLVDLSPYETKK